MQRQGLSLLSVPVVLVTGNGMLIMTNIQRLELIGYMPLHVLHQRLPMPDQLKVSIPKSVGLNFFMGPLQRKAHNLTDSLLHTKTR